MRVRSRFWRLLPAAIAGGMVGLAGVAGGGCAARQAPSSIDRPVPGADDQAGRGGAGAEPTTAGAEAGTSIPSPLPPPPTSPTALTIESADARLAAAVAALGASETVATLNDAAAEYLRLGIFDRANALLNRAIKLAPTDARSYAARARVWRDWGLPDVGLTDAHRAVFLAPESADAHNTLGTVLFAVGAMDAAAASFERALALEPGAAWAQSNLCYVALMRGDERAALDRCAAALEQAPALTTARINLALVHASAGRLDDARAEFLSAGDRPAGLYNMGIVLMARRDYAAAAEAFGTACRETPSFAAACRRAAECRALGRDEPAREKQP